MHPRTIVDVAGASLLLANADLLGLLNELGIATRSCFALVPISSPSPRDSLRGAWSRPRSLGSSSERREACCTVGS
jgi:hypothetical protein